MAGPMSDLVFSFMGGGLLGLFVVLIAPSEFTAWQMLGCVTVLILGVCFIVLGARGIMRE
jgi:hypothetical protein